MSTANSKSGPSTKRTFDKGRFASTTFLGASIAVLAWMLLIALGDLQEIKGSVSALQGDLIELQGTTLEAIGEIQQGASPEDMAKYVKVALEQEAADAQRRAYQAVESKYLAAVEQPLDDRIYGNLDAEFSIIEFSDFECPYCKRFHANPKTVVDASGGQVNWAWKHFPLDFHNPVAKDAAVAAECVATLAGNRAFWVFAQMFFDETQLNGKGVPGGVRDVALKAGAPADKIDSCLADRAMVGRVEADVKFGREAGVSGTPGVFVVHQPTDQVIRLPGAVSSQEIQEAINQLKARVADGAPGSAGSEPSQG